MGRPPRCIARRRMEGGKSTQNKPGGATQILAYDAPSCLCRTASRRLHEQAEARDKTRSRNPDLENRCSRNAVCRGGGRPRPPHHDMAPAAFACPVGSTRVLRRVGSVRCAPCSRSEPQVDDCRFPNQEGNAEKERTEKTTLSRGCPLCSLCCLLFKRDCLQKSAVGYPSICGSLGLSMSFPVPVS